MTVRPGIKYGALAVAGVGAAAVVAVWSYREPIARDAIDDYLAARGVPASYDIRAIETRRQRLEHIRIGNPAHPDLTADWAEIDVGPSLSGLTVKAVRAGGVRLRGRLVQGGLTLGTVDRLLPARSGAPFRLPDIDLSLEDARMRLDTPYGQIGAKVDGQGDLRGGFEGKLALVAPTLARDVRCAAQGVTAYGDISIIARRPTFQGPVRLASLNCGSLRGTEGALLLDASVAESGADWRGSGNLDLRRASVPGARAADVKARAAFRGDARKTDADVTLRLGELIAGDVRAARTLIAGQATLGRRGLVFNGRLAAADVAAPRLVSRAAGRLSAVPQGLPVSPAARQLAQALTGLNRGMAGRASIALSYVDAQPTFALSDLRVSSASGAGFDLSGKDVVTYDERGTRLSGLARFGGGGFPAGRAELSGAGGIARLAPFVSNGSRIVLAPVRFAALKDGLSVDTQAVIDGPLGSGRITGLVVPLRLVPGRAFPSGCLPVAFRQVRVAALRIGPTRLAPCLTDEGITIAAPRLRGAMGASPFRLDAAAGRYSYANGGFRLTGVDATIGGADRLSRINADVLDGRSVAGGFSGTVNGAAGQIGAVPLRLSDAAGRWSFRSGMLRIDGDGTLSDTAPDRRFLPMRAADMRVTLRGGQVHGTVRLAEPKSGAEVADVAFGHDLASGVGSADLDVAALTFGPRLQPEAITPKTLGVVANVFGTVRGRGRIDWTGDAVRSTGQFRTEGLNFAAAFGPVEGMKGEIAFSDLLGLVTAPDQKVTIAAINPGIAVTQGVITYRLLPGYRAQVDGGRWPFAGGFLILEPTVLDMSSAAARRLTFRVEGLDAARFIAAMEFDNVAATGIFDGELPMVFDDQGGRIVGGKLVARGGGTLSYVGQVSNENLGTMGRFAFDALKSMKYDRLAIDLDGAIDGDVITRISFAGVNQAPIDGGRAKLPIKILGATNLPFIFNVTITAKFRQLFDMARSFNDPSILINRMVPKLEPLPVDERKPPKAVQPPESGRQP